MGNGMITRAGRAGVKRRFDDGSVPPSKAGGTGRRGAFLRDARLAIGILVVLAVAACGAGTAPAATTSAAATSPPAASPPPGGPAPSQLVGTWTRQTPTDTVTLTLTASTYEIEVATGKGGGDIVVNGDEIDFFSSPRCLPLVLPQGVGRYRWTLQGNTLHLAPLNTDPCGRVGLITNQSFTKSGP